MSTNSYHPKAYQSYIDKMAQFFMIDNNITSKTTVEEMDDVTVGKFLRMVYQGDWIDSFESQLMCINCCNNKLLHRAIYETQEVSDFSSITESEYLTRVARAILAFEISYKIRDLIKG